MREPYIIIDVDGTLADNSWRDPFDYEQGYADPVIDPVRDLAVMLIDAGNIPVFVSGRPREHYELTAAWLKRAFSWPSYAMIELHMRRTGDNRPDDIVKLELYEANISGRYVRYVLDDRARVVKMWRALGLTVLDVAGHEY